MSPRVLLLGGHGKVSLFMTPLLLSRSWNVTSLVRNAAHEADIKAAAAKATAGKAGLGKVDVLISSLLDVKSEGDAQKILDDVKPDYVIWSAGAGGKGGPEATYAIDRDAACHFIAATTHTSSIKKLLLVSALSQRNSRAPWWDDESWGLVTHMNEHILPAYYKAKMAADETLTVLGEERKKKDKDFQWICLRPGGLSDEEGKGKISLGRTKAKGTIPRQDVADVAVRLLERDDTNGWIDLLGGENETGAEIDRVVKEGIDCIQGEEISAFKVYNP